MEKLISKIINTELGDLHVVVCDQYIHGAIYDLHYAQGFHIKMMEQSNPGESALIDKFEAQLKEYLLGRRRQFDLSLKLVGTDFQKQCWGYLKTIKYGETKSYQDQAIYLGDLNKSRAVGSANGKNPLSIVIPCHRVIAKNGSLGGYAGGLKAKKLLLKLESENQ